MTVNRLGRATTLPPVLFAKVITGLDAVGLADQACAFEMPRR
jgi:hypothetical protein